MDLIIYRGDIRKIVKFPSDNQGIFDYLYEWDPYYFNSPTKDYYLYKIVKKLNDLICERNLFDKANTRFIVLDKVLSEITGVKYMYYKYFQGNIEKLFNCFDDNDSIQSQNVQRTTVKIIYAGWHRPNTFANKVIIDSDFFDARKWKLFVLPNSPLFEIINKELQDEGELPLFEDSLMRLNDIVDYIRSYADETCEGDDDYYYITKGTLLESVTQCSVIKQKHLPLFVSANCLVSENPFCVNCGRRPVLYTQRSHPPFCNDKDSSDSDTER